VLLLAQTRSSLCGAELENLAKSNQLNNWSFPEWIHGKTGQPRGMKNQSWSAAMYILAYQVVCNNYKFSI
jgi:glycogen debranching enzyme